VTREQTESRERKAAASIAQRLETGSIVSRQELESAKREVSRSYSLDRYLSNSEVLAALTPEARNRFEELLRMHPRRSASGIVVVTAFSAPFLCPHGTCIFCPGGPRAQTPQSYMPDSPGMKTALRAAFDPYRQVQASLEKYATNGHSVGKVETIIEGGTFLAVPPEYQLNFVKGVYDGLNGFLSESLAESQAANEGATSRCVGLTLETKPDWCRPRDVDTMLEYGVTRVEVGVQSLQDHVLERSNRGHSFQDSVDAFQVARDAGLKVVAHMMPGLPGADPETDLKEAKSLFADESLRPDMMKVYPTLVVEGTALARQFEAGAFSPYDLETVVGLLSEVKRYVPRWHRIMRIQREIPAHEILAGVKNGNLRELVLSKARKSGHPCGCIRCREVALGEPGVLGDDDELRYMESRYEASGGVEVFGSFEYERGGKIAGFFRLRLPSSRAHRAETRGSSILRELRVYGRAVSVGDARSKAWQHKGLGRWLMGEAEKVAREDFDSRSILVTSAVGTRNYYRKLGYESLGPYMHKTLSH